MTLYIAFIPTKGWITKHVHQLIAKPSANCLTSDSEAVVVAQALKAMQYDPDKDYISVYEVPAKQGLQGEYRPMYSKRKLIKKLDAEQARKIVGNYVISSNI